MSGTSTASRSTGRGVFATQFLGTASGQKMSATAWDDEQPRSKSVSYCDQSLEEGRIEMLSSRERVAHAHRPWLMSSQAARLVRTVTVLALTAAFVELSLAATDYDDARDQARVDTTSAAYRSWFGDTMQPAFNRLFQSLLDTCPVRPPETLQGFGLVLSVQSDGRVKQVIWKTPSGITACLELGLRGARLPAAPKEEFFLGLEIAPHAALAQPRSR